MIEQDGQGIRFGVLGPLVVQVAGRQVRIPGRRQRTLLAALLLHRGMTVPVPRLAELMFGEDQPVRPRSALQTYVGRLRAAFGPHAQVLVTKAPGYLLDVPPESVDAERFVRAVRAQQGASGPAAALAGLGEALALWRGPAYGEFADGFAQGEARRLEELRLTAEEERARRLLEVGRAVDSVGALDRLLAEAPWRESAVALLATALAGEQRTAEALEALAAYRGRLRGELGLDPSVELLRLEKDVLRGKLAKAGASEAARAIRGRARVGVPMVGGGSFVGRESEAARLAELLVSGGVVTVTGAGGVGKSRLAAEVCDGSGEVAWAELAEVSREPGTAVARAVAGAVGVESEPGQSWNEALGMWARDTASGVLVLDGCEHVRDPVIDVVTTVSASSRLTVLVTSRVTLGLPGERLMSLAPLPVGAPTGPGPAERLFLDRARDASPDFTADGRLLARVREICHAVDALPLAIELAAAHTGSLTVDDLADRIDERFGLLRRPDAAGSPRHRSLDALASWSYDLLEPDERRLFLRLSVFAGEFDLVAAEAVTAYEDLPPHAVAYLVGRLVSSSLLVRTVDAGVGRYLMLRTHRRFAQARLAGHEADRLRTRLAAHRDTEA